MFGGVGPLELIVFGTIALLLFGKRLPEVARSLGKGIVEFKKGIRGIEDEVNSATYRSSTPPRRPQPVDDEPQDLTAPKFEPPTSEPVSNTHES
jgi:sec-independent protein translocase protein TatA